MPRESIERKAHRLLTSGAVLVLQAAAPHVHAVVDGDHGTYHVKCDGAHWRCSCPARVTPCAHVTAVALVSGPPRKPQNPDTADGDPTATAAAVASTGRRERRAPRDARANEWFHLVRVRE